MLRWKQLQAALGKYERVRGEGEQGAPRAGHVAYCRHLRHCWPQSSSPPETPMFVVCICVPVLSMCVYTHVCLYMLAVFVCVCPAQGRSRDEGGRRGGAEQPEEES